MAIDSDKIAALISDRIQGKLSDANQNELDSWLSESHNKDLFNKLIKRHYLLNKNDQYNQFEQEKADAWGNIQQRKQKRINLTRIIQYAAAVLIPLVVFFAVFNLSDQPDVNQQIAAYEVKPGERKAVLVLSNGEQVALSAADTSITMSQSGTIIRVDSLGARYNDAKSGGGELQFNTIQTTRGMEYDLYLADGTRVWLNSESSLRYPENFSGNTREVYASGEVFLEVAKDKDKPFFVHFNNKKVEVLGTAFNVRSYDDEKTDVVTLAEGSISLNTGSEKLIMEPNKQAVIDNGGNIQMKDVKAMVYGAWRKGKFVYDKAPLEQIVKDMARWYQVDVFYQNASVKTKRISMYTQRSNNIDEILEIIEAAEEVSFELSNKSLVVRSK